MKRKIAYGCVMLLLMMSVCYMGHAQSEGQQPQPVAQPKKKAEPPPFDPRLPGKEKDDKKDDKKEKDDAPPKVVGVDDAGSDSVAVLPINLVRNRLENMKDGTKAYVSTDTIRVDGKRRVWLHPHALLGPKSSDRPLLVSKEPAGYTVLIESTSVQWDAEDFDPGQVKWIPVKNLVTK